MQGLQGWRRRSMLSQKKVSSVIRLLRSQESSSTTANSCLELLISDFEYINANIKDAGRRLESMIPVVTSLVQIVDSRRSFAETENISRLTVLALVFVPLSYISSVFSMNPINAPGSQYFWVYFAVAIPVTLFVVLIARPPGKEILALLHWIKSRKQRKVAYRGYQPDDLRV
jgi:Mg2+ and Co2+ transporter CorA